MSRPLRTTSARCCGSGRASVTAWTNRITGRLGSPAARWAARRRACGEAWARKPRTSSSGESDAAATPPCSSGVDEGAAGSIAATPGTSVPVLPATSSAQCVNQRAEGSRSGSGSPACSSGGGSYGVNRRAELAAAGPVALSSPAAPGSAVRRQSRSGSGWTTATGIVRAQRPSTPYQRLVASWPAYQWGPLQSLRTSAAARPSRGGRLAGRPPGDCRSRPSSVRASSLIPRNAPVCPKTRWSSRHNGRQTGIVGPASYTR